MSSLQTPGSSAPKPSATPKSGSFSLWDLTPKAYLSEAGLGAQSSYRQAKAKSAPATHASTTGRFPPKTKYAGEALICPAPQPAPNPRQQSSAGSTASQVSIIIPSAPMQGVPASQAYRDTPPSIIIPSAPVHEVPASQAYRDSPSSALVGYRGPPSSTGDRHTEGLTSSAGSGYAGGPPTFLLPKQEYPPPIPPPLPVASTPPQPPSSDQIVTVSNLPREWTKSSALHQLAATVEHWLKQAGPLDVCPIRGILQMADGWQVVAVMSSPGVAREAAERLNGLDNRSEEERMMAQAQRFKPPLQPHEKFVVKLGGTVAAQSKTRLKQDGVYLHPLPVDWGEYDVTMFARQYGPVTNVQVSGRDAERGAFINYASPIDARHALYGLHGLTLPGSYSKRLTCSMQEEFEPPVPIRRFSFYLDELPMPHRPDVEPGFEDVELFLDDIPKPARSEAELKDYLGMFGAEPLEVNVLRESSTGKLTKRAYARFEKFNDAFEVLQAICDDPGEGFEKLKVRWSESERALQGIRSMYGLDLLTGLCGPEGSKLTELRKDLERAGTCIGVDVCAENIPDTFKSTKSPNGDRPGKQVHFVIHCEKLEQVEMCRVKLKEALVEFHEAYHRDVMGSLEIRGFPSSWGAKEMKFIFVPFGGVSSLKFQGEGDQRMAFVKLKNSEMSCNAEASLHNTKVGDGDLVEECTIKCQHRHLRTWLDGSFLGVVFIDELDAPQRPEVEAGPEDRELFVRNLPLQDTSLEELREYFEGFGAVEDVNLITSTITGAHTGNGYVSFENHEDAAQCAEAIQPTADDLLDIAGYWAESERALQLKDNCYDFNLISELVGRDGCQLERLKNESGIRELWMMAGSLIQKDPWAPPCTSNQFHFAARCDDSSQLSQLKRLLTNALQEIHASITERFERKQRKAERKELEAQQQYPVNGGSHSAPSPVPGWYGQPWQGSGPSPGYGKGGYPPPPPPPPPPPSSREDRHAAIRDAASTDAAMEAAFSIPAQPSRRRSRNRHQQHHGDFHAQDGYDAGQGEDQWGNSHRQHSNWHGQDSHDAGQGKTQGAWSQGRSRYQQHHDNRSRSRSRHRQDHGNWHGHNKRRAWRRHDEVDHHGR